MLSAPPGRVEYEPQGLKPPLGCQLNIRRQYDMGLNRDTESAVALALNMELRALNFELLEVGGADRDRTGDPLLAKQVLSQLSYSPLLAQPLALSH